MLSWTRSCCTVQGFRMDAVTADSQPCWTVTMRLVGIPSALSMCYKAAGGRLGKQTGLPPCVATDDTAPGSKEGVSMKTTVIRIERLRRSA